METSLRGFKTAIHRRGRKTEDSTPERVSWLQVQAEEEGQDQYQQHTNPNLLTLIVSIKSTIQNDIQVDHDNNNNISENRSDTQQWPEEVKDQAAASLDRLQATRGPWHFNKINDP